MKKLWTLTLIVLAAAGTARAQVYVVDKGGQKIGPYSFVDSSDGDATVLRQIDDRWFQLPIRSEGFGVENRATYNTAIYFPKAGCRGTVYMGNQILPTESMVISATLGGDAALIRGQTLYWPDVRAQLEDVSVCAMAQGSVCQNFSCENMRLAPAKTFDLGSLHFEPPFRLEVVQDTP